MAGVFYTESNDWESDDLKGRVKSLKQDIYGAVEKFGKGRNDDNYLTTYNALGNAIEKNSYSGSGVLKWKVIYKYDKQGNKIEESRYDKEVALEEKDTYKNTPTTTKATG